MCRRQAAAFVYPNTPDLARAVTQRLTTGERGARGATRRPGALRPGWVIASVVLVLAAGLLAVPEVRGAVIEVLRIGAVRILRLAPAEPAPAGAPAATVVPLSTVLDLAGETTLEAARTQVDFPLALPQYPPDLGAPDAVFVQNVSGPAVILAWTDETDPATVTLSLYQIAASAYFTKIAPKVIEETEVAGREAIWAEGPHLLLDQSGDFENRRLVEGNVLIWTAGPVTYRLETALGLAEARRIAESLR